ncbi:MAG: hypothetical protein QGH45_14210 [Myxococcota bacterium]|jgi:hypothetical protein|nr:hypothetical protein [Myxococcota bacterium]
MKSETISRLEDKPLDELLAIRAHLMRGLRGLDPGLINGSLARTSTTCGRAGCRCQRGDKHVKTNLCKKVDGRSCTTYVPQDLVEEVRRGTEQFRRAKALLKEIADVNWAIIRGHGRRQREKRDAAKRSRVVGR